MCCKSLRARPTFLTFEFGFADTLTLLRVELVPFARICSFVGTALLLTSCGSDLVLPGDEPIPAIRVVDGDGQTGEIGEVLSKPVLVEVTDANDQPIANATVEFQLIAAGDGGGFSPATTTTNALGQADAQLQLGDKIGVQIAEAHLMLDGATASKATFSAIASPPNPQNRSPDADFNWHCEDLTCQFIDASSDPDGDVTGWSWQFGDDNTADVADPGHVYPAPGTYTVRLSVTDNGGATDDTSTEVEVTVSAPPPPQNESPRAEFEVHCHDQFCSFEDRSRDDDGAVVSWSWDFGDGSGSNDQSPFHFYREEGHYDVTLTVTDNEGGSASKTHQAKIKD
jgi:PKD repeat protein